MDRNPILEALYVYYFVFIEMPVTAVIKAVKGEA